MLYFKISSIWSDFNGRKCHEYQKFLLDGYTNNTLYLGIIL